MCSLPARIKFRDAELKYLFRRAVAPLLPKPILDRTDKMGFPVPLQHWARGRARDFFHDTLLSRACRDRGLFDMDAVRRLIDGDENYGRALWGLMQLELWHQQFIDQPATAAA
jgi:asparagine synthase (glutamine-hydrolysing)